MTSLRKFGIWGVAVLNVLDAVLTLVDLHTGFGAEANPIMAALIRVSPVLFVGLKVLFSVFFVELMYKSKQTYNGLILLLFLMYLVIVINNSSLFLYIEFFQKHI